ncbi:MAG TPA: histidine phosphatase family protein [Burkholderiales bacterium]
MAAAELILVRHGETTWNREGRLQGHTDIPLSETGFVQADELAARLAGEAFDALYSSDLMRARQTAERVARRTGHPIVVDSRLRERNLGVLQSFTRDESARVHPEVYERYRRGEAGYVIPGGESASQFFARVIGALTAIAAGLAGRRAVIVSHGGVLDALYRVAAGEGPDGPRKTTLLNASINTFHYRDGRWTLHLWGDISHLGRDRALDDV